MYYYVLHQPNVINSNNSYIGQTIQSMKKRLWLDMRDRRPHRERLGNHVHSEKYVMDYSNVGFWPKEYKKSELSFLKMSQSALSSWKKTNVKDLNDVYYYLLWKNGLFLSYG